jgi:hypothetical protein
MDAVGRESERLQLSNLVFHQCDQRADHQRCPAEHDAGKLVAERLAGPGRHNEHNVTATSENTADFFLVGPERLVAEAVLEDVVEAAAALPGPTRG